MLSADDYGQQWASHTIQEAKKLLCKDGVLLVDSLESASPLLTANSLLNALESSIGMIQIKGELPPVYSRKDYDCSFEAMHGTVLQRRMGQKDDMLLFDSEEVSNMVQKLKDKVLKLHVGILGLRYFGFAGPSDFGPVNLDLLLPAFGFKHSRKVAQVMPEGVERICRSVYIAVSDGKIAPLTSEVADTTRRTTLTQMGVAAGNPAVKQAKMRQNVLISLCSVRSRQVAVSSRTRLCPQLLRIH